MRWQARPYFDLEQWHKWFAWHPVRVVDTWVWLETVQRKMNYYAFECLEWEYKL